jgi:hypothetical protein
MRTTLSIRRIYGGSADGDDETQRRGVFGILEKHPELRDRFASIVSVVETMSWREAKIPLAHARGSTTPVYAGAIEGGVETAGRQLFEYAVRAGFGANSRVHAVGDGAPWIVGQVEEQFGAEGS